MGLFFRSITNTRRRSPNRYLSDRRLVDASTIRWIRDRGLDHAVEKEKNLKPLINIKNFIKSEPSKSIPISIIADNREKLQIPTRPIEFIRNYPSIFEEFLPGGIAVHPHFRLTSEVLSLDADEQLMYQSESYRQQAADRLLKLLMLVRINKIPLYIIDRLKWDLGLPPDYVQTLIPEFPDYFRIEDAENRNLEANDNRVLELVCWSNELAVSVMEKKASKGEMGYEKGMPMAFSLQYSRGFEIDKKFKRWVDGWQKLPYISPYEAAFHLAPTSDDSDKWAVAVLHELLHILVPKKTDRENLLCLGEYLGLRSRFKRALLHHPGIFYLSSKIGTHTVVLREGYKRDLLIEKHKLMVMRSQYIHLMNKVKELPKPKSGLGDSTQQQGTTSDSRRKGEEDEENGEEQDAESRGLSDSEVEDISDGDSDAEEDEDRGPAGARKNYALSGERRTKRRNFEVKGPFGNPAKKKTVQRNTVKKVPSKFGDSDAEEDEDRGHAGTQKNYAFRRERRTERRNLEVKDPFGNPAKEKTDQRNTGKRKDKVPSKFRDSHAEEDEDRGHAGARKDYAFSRERTKRRNLEVKGPFGNPENEKMVRRNTGKTKDKVPSKFSLRSEMHNGNHVHGRLSKRSNSVRSRGKSSPDRTTA